MFFSKTFYLRCLHAALFLTCAFYMVTNAAAADILSASERAWLVEHPEIRVAYSQAYPPISFKNQKGEPSGLAADYFKIIEARLGVKFKLVVPTIKERGANNPKVKNVDMVSVFVKTPDREKYWTFTKPYLDFPLYLIGSRDVPDGLTLEDIAKRSVGVVGYYAERELLEANYPSVEIQPVDDTCSGLQHVAFGIYDSMLTDLTVASWCMRQQGNNNLKVLSKTKFRYESSIAVRKDWPELQAIIDKGLAAVTAAERAEIYKRWNADNLFEESWLQKYKLWVVGLALMIISLALMRLFVWDNMLQQRILNRFTNPDMDKTAALPHRDSHKLVMISGLIFLLGLLVTFWFILTNNRIYAPMEAIVSIVAMSILVLLTLAGGYKIGSLGRGRQVEGLFKELMQQVKNREKTELMFSESGQRLKRQNKALQTIVTDQLKIDKQPADVFKAITEIVAHAMDVDRVSIWMYGENNEQLLCMDMFELVEHTHSDGQILRVEDHPYFFTMFATQRVMAVDDVEVHSAAAELAEKYFSENGVGAFIYANVWLDNNVIGAVCCEHVGGSREWALDEQSFTGSVADMVRVTIESKKRHDAEQVLAQHTENLEEIVKVRTAALENSANMFKFIVDNAPATIITMDLQGNILEANPEVLRVSNFSRDYVVGKNYYDLFSEFGNGAGNAPVPSALNLDQQVHNEEFMFTRKDGLKIELSISRSMEYDASGNPIIISIGQDISKQKAVESELIKAREAAEGADRIKSMFVASMSHELRTPLNSIIGFLGVVLQGMSGKINPTQKDQLGRAYHSAKHLLALISDVIDISKIEAGFLQIHVEKFELQPLLIEAEQAIQHITEDKNLAVSIVCDEGVMLETDRKRLYQVVLNVLSNAAKYTEKGSVTVKAIVDGDRLVITTEDTGIGIDEAGLAELFQPFERVESRLKMKILGTGLGLYLTKKILMQLLGGNITVVSRPEEGSIFTIELPLLAPEADTEVESVLEKS